MTTHFSYDCPHCLTRSAGFEVRFQWNSPVSPYHAQLLAVCGLCKQGLLILSSAASAPHLDLSQCDVPYPGSHFEVMETWPKFMSACPDHVPANIETFYDQGLENLSAGRWDAAGAMFRKSLDVATKTLAPEHRSATLFKRINKMVDAGQLTPSMGDWSHEIRLDGNDAIHDDEPESEIDARATQKFAEAFLTYVYALPEMVRLNRKKRRPANDAASGSAA